MSAFEKHKFTDAVKDQLAEADPQAGSPQVGPPEPGGPGSTHDEIAEQARRDEEARLTRRTREERLIDIGRADQTSGRQ